MKSIAYLLFAQVVIALIAISIATIPFTNDNVKRQRISDALRYTAETTAFIEANDPQLKKQFDASKEFTNLIVWDYIEAIYNRNATEGYVLLSFLCSNLGIAAFLVFRKNEKKKSA